jgi:hypothetical protein
VLRLLPLVFICGCVSSHSPRPIDTKFDESKRDWVEIYQNEIKISIDNQDRDAYKFFMFELLKEKIRLKRLNEKSIKKNNTHSK